MADDKKKDAKPAGGEGGGDTKPAKKGLPVKTIGVVAGVMLIEAVALFALFKLTGPKPVKADTEKVEAKSDEGETLTEIEVAAEKFQNMQQGRVWFWDLAIVVQVKKKHEAGVTASLERRNAEIKEGLSQIVGRAQPAQLKEPDRQTLNRQFSEYLNKVFGTDAEGKPLIERVIIPRCRGIPGE